MEPYHTAKQVFAIMDNGSSHRGQKCIDRLERSVRSRMLGEIKLRVRLFTILVLAEADIRQRLAEKIKDIAWSNLEHANLVSNNDNCMSA